MVDSIIIAGLTIAITNVIKVNWPYLKTAAGKTVLPLIALAISAILMVTNAAVFGGMPVKTALANGIEIGAIITGIYSMGKKHLEKDDGGNTNADS